MKKIFLLAGAFLFTGLLTAQPADDKNYDEVFTVAGAWLQAQRDYNQLPSLTVAAVHDQDLLWEDAFGLANPARGVAATPSTINSICSITKLFTATAIMQLYDAGKLRLDDRIEDVLPWFDLQQQYHDSSPITIRDLLTHSAGLPRENTYVHWNAPFDFPTKDQIKATLKNQQTLYRNAEQWQYSNLGMTILGYVVEEVSGEPFEEYVQKHILDPLRMRETYTSMPRPLHGNKLAVGYSVNQRDGRKKAMPFFTAKGVTPAAGFASTVGDLARFAQWQFRLLSDSAQTELLKPATLRSMHNVHWTDADFSTTWGLGYAVWKGDDGTKWVSHSGHCPGYKTTFILNPKSKMAYAVMINTSGADPGMYARNLNKLVNRAVTTEGDQPDFSEYAGYYDWSSMGETFVYPWGDKLATLWLSAENPAGALELYERVDGDTFVLVKDDGSKGATLNFQRGKDGKVKGYRIENYVYTRTDRPVKGINRR